MTNRKKSKPKLSVVGPISPMNMIWERLILLSLSKKRPKTFFQTPGVPATGDLACALWVQQHSIIQLYFGTPCSGKLWLILAST